MHEEGWWLGVNETGPSDKTLTILRVDALDFHTIGFSKLPGSVIGYE